jgi:hypothetical protein
MEKLLAESIDFDLLKMEIKLKAMNFQIAIYALQLFVRTLMAG